MNVSKALLKWYQNNYRELPWRQTRDAYIIWLSEIILQQTRVEQGTPYFLRFVKRYPNVRKLAQASENEILKMWQGLGYYSRARNLHAAAKSIVDEHNGIFPDQFESIRKLKGVGDYTAAAIASFAFDQPFAVVDGNVYRFLSRLFGVDTPIDSTTGKKQFSELAAQLLDKKDPGTHNQAIMEFGSILCKPANPDCSICPFREQCVAYRENRIAELPVKSRKGKVKIRYFNYVMIRYNNRIYMNQRASGDIWSKLYELPLIESDKTIAHQKLIRSAEWKSLIGSQQFHLKSVKDYPVHKLSHQHIHTRLFELVMKEKPKELLSSPFIDIKESEVFKFPVSRLMESILTDHIFQKV